MDEAGERGRLRGAPADEGLSLDRSDRRYRGAFLLRRDDGGEVEFVTITRFDSMDAVRAFAGDDEAASVVLPEAEALLTRFDARSYHYETVIEPD
jgi:hypothetical protein